MGLIHRARTTRAVAIVAAIAMISMLAIGPRGALALFQQFSDSPSAATGHAGVIAQGVSALPEGSSVWRVSQATATALDSGEPTNYGLGFTMATGGGVLVNDYTSGLQQRLSSGEAAFSESGAFQQHVALNGSEVSYLRIGLTSGNGADGGENVVYASDAFSSVGGLRDLDLVRDVLADGEETTVNAGSAPSLLYVLSGEVTVDDGNSTSDLGAGNGTTINGAFSVQAKGAAVIVAAVIGDEVPAPPRISGTVTIDVRVCPDGVTKDAVTQSVGDGSTEEVDKCTALDDPVKAGFQISLNPSDGNALPLTSARQTTDKGVLIWENLAFGDYALSDIVKYPDGYGDSAMSNGNLNIGDHSAFTLNRDNPDVYRVLYLFKSAAQGSITVNFHKCFVDDFELFDPASCEPLNGGLPAQIQFGADGVLTNDDALTGDDPSYTWENLAVATSPDPQPTDPGSYTLGFAVQDTGTNPRVVVNGADPIGETGFFSVVLTSDQPTAEVDYYLIHLPGEVSTGIYVSGIICPSAEATIAECDSNGATALAAMTIPVASGSAIDQSSATVSSGSFVWSDLPVDDTYTISTANIVPPDGYTIRTILYYQTGETGDAFDVTLTSDAPNADFLVYLDPIVPDEGEGTPSGG